MDAETKSYLLEMKEDIINSVTKVMKESNAALEKSLREVHDLKIQIVNDKADKSMTYHAEHFKEFKEVHKRIDHLESRQSQDEGKEIGASKAKNEMTTNTKVILSIIGALITVVGFFAGFMAKGGP